MSEDKKTDNNRDLLGDQMGYAVRKIMPPTPELEAADRFIMRAIPRPLARIVALIRFDHGWLPDRGDPVAFYSEFTDKLGKLYLTHYGDKMHANTLNMPGFGSDIKVHSESFADKDTEHSLNWSKQLEWANRTIERATTELNVSSDEIGEATLIQQINSNLVDMVGKLQPQFIKRGLPIPEMPVMPKSSQK